MQSIRSKFQLLALASTCLTLWSCGSEDPTAPSETASFEVVQSQAETPSTVVGTSLHYDKSSVSPKSGASNKPASKQAKGDSKAPAKNPEPITPSALTEKMEDSPSSASQEPPQAPQEEQNEINEYSVIIREVSFQDDNRKPLPSSTYQPFIYHKKNSPMKLEKLAEDAAALQKQFPEFVTITTRLDPVQGKKNEAKLTFEFLRRRVIRSVQIIVPSSEKDVPKDLREKLLTSAGKNIKEDDLLRDSQTLRQIFIGMGYPKNSVSHEIKIIDKKQGSVSVHFLVKLGSAKAVNAGFQFKGNRSFNQEQLQKQMKNMESSWTTFFTGADSFDITKLELDVNSLVEFYQDQGFPNAQVGYAYQVDTKGKTRTIVTIKEGKRYSIRKISIQGNKEFNTAKIRQQLTFGENSSYSAKNFRTSLQNIRELYGEKGFASASAAFEFDQKNSSLQIIIAEGNQKFVERVEIKGNTNSKETLIINQMKLVEGDLVNTKLITDSTQALQKTGYFSDVKVEFVPNPQREDFGTILVTVKEEDRRTLDFGISYGTQSGLGGDARLGFSNINGSGMDFSVQAFKSEEMTRLAAVFRQRNLLDTQNDLSVSTSYSEMERNEYDKNVIAARVMLERQIYKNTTLGVGTRLEFVGIENVQAGMPAEAFAAQGSYQPVAGLVSTVVFENEKMDSSGEAVGGQKIRMSFLPSYSDKEIYLKAAASAIQHVKLGTDSKGRSHVLSGRVTLAYVGENAPFHEKLYAGGENNLRGYKYYGVTPTGSKIGGTNLVSAGTYYSFPITGDTFRGVAFLEAASVGNGFSDLGDVRAVGGVGVRANLSKTLLSSKIEAGLVLPILKKPTDEVNPFYVMFGNYHPVYDL